MLGYTNHEAACNRTCRKQWSDSVCNTCAAKYDSSNDCGSCSALYEDYPNLLPDLHQQHELQQPRPQCEW